MTLRRINIGATPNDKTGDSLREALGLTNVAIDQVSANTLAIAGKVDKAAGMGLSQNSFTNEQRDKLSGLEGSHWRGTFLSFSALQAVLPTANAGDYADVDAGAGSDVQRYIWDVSDAKWVAQQGVAATITAAQIKTLYESNLNTNAFSDAERQKLDDVDPGATRNRADAETASAASVAQAIAMAATFTVVPTNFQAWCIVVTLPHLRFMVWSSAKYVRAPWHRPCDLFYSYDSPASISGALQVRGDVVYQQSSYPDVVERLGLTGAGTFTLVEARGEYLRVLDNGRSVDVGRELRSFQADEIKAHAHQYIYPEGVGAGRPQLTTLADYAAAATRLPTAQTIATGTTGGAENRVRNIAFPLWMTF